MKPLFSAILTALFLLTANTSFAQTNPSTALEASVEKLLAEFTENRAELESDKSKLHRFAEDILVETWDFSKMAQLVLGKNWRKITPDQQQRFSQAFQNLLIRTYASAMFKYTGNENINFEQPVYKGKNNKRAIVNASGSLGNGSNDIPLTFSVYLDKQNIWRIYNVAISGVSLVLTYRTSYNQIIASKGIEHLIDSLNVKNAA